MGINIGDNKLLAAYYKDSPVLKIYIKDELVWPILSNPTSDDVLSCYYNGYWIDEYPWTDDTPWTD